VSTKNAFATEKNTVLTLSLLSLGLTLVLAALPLLVAPVFFG
jgi:hypothetical protein